MKICIDPGHGQYGNPGVISGYYEGTQMFKLSYFQKEEWEKYEGVEVLVTRKTLKDDPSLWDRGAMGKGFDLFYSNHSNATGTPINHNVRGTSIYDSFEKPSTELATIIGKTISSVMGHTFRGVNHRESTSKAGQDWYGVLRSAIRNGVKVAFLVEHGFHTNREDCGFLLQDANLRKLAKAEVEAIAAHYGLKLKAPSTPQVPDPDPTVMYYVQTGAFSKKANADAQYHKIKAAGFDALIKKSGNLYRVQAGAFRVRAYADAFALKLKGKGFDTYVTTTGGVQVPAGSAPAPAKKLAVGSKVKIKSSATRYSTGQRIPGWVKANTYTVQQLGSGKALLKEIISWVNTSDLTLI